MLRGSTNLPPEDLRKLHSEINQLVHQRFLVTTGAVSVFGLVGAWMVASPAAVIRDAAGKEVEKIVGPFIYASTILLVCLLLLLFALSFCLKRTVRQLSSYLIVTGKSAWELDWAAYRTKWVYWGYSKPLSVVFGVLGLFALGFPFLFMAVRESSLKPGWGLGLHIAVSVVYLISVLLYGFFELGDQESEAISKWEKLRDDPGLGAIQPQAALAPVQQAVAAPVQQAAPAPEDPRQ